MIADMLHQTETVRNEEVGQVMVALQFSEQIHDLRLNRNIQCRGRFVQDEQFGIECQRPRQGHALRLPATELMREAFQIFVTQTDLRQ